MKSSVNIITASPHTICSGKFPFGSQQKHKKSSSPLGLGPGRLYISPASGVVCTGGPFSLRYSDEHFRPPNDLQLQNVRFILSPNSSCHRVVRQTYGIRLCTQGRDKRDTVTLSTNLHVSALPLQNSLSLLVL